MAVQDRYDLSVRLEWDPRMGDDGRWKIVANTLADLTKRENRYEHHYFRFISNSPDLSDRVFPFGMVSVGNGYGGGDLVRFVADPELFPPANEPRWNTVTRAADNLGATHDLNNFVARFVQRTDLQNPTYSARPFAYVQGDNGTGAPVTARAILNDEGNVVGVVHGPAPHWGAKRGSDVMLTDALAFDIRAYDPGAPLFGVLETPTGSYNPNNPNHVLAAVVEPSDPGWGTAYRQQVSAVNDTIIPNHGTFPLVGQGAYVDLGYGLQFFPPQFEQGYAAQEIWFFNASWTPDRIGQQLAPGYSVFDTWSLHYEHNGVNEDNDLDENDTPMIDEGTDRFDNRDPAVNGNLAEVDHVEDIAHSGVDDVGERETIPPYERPLRGVQIKLRAFERDSQQLREVTVGQHFLPE